MSTASRRLFTFDKSATESTFQSVADLLTFDFVASVMQHYGR